MLRLTMVIALIGMLAWPAQASAAPVRSVDDVAFAIGVDHGHLPLQLRETYAKALVATAARHDFDPLTAVSLIRNESRFRSGAIGDHGDAVGLGQIHYRYLCKTIEACALKRLSLLDPVNNIAAMGQLISQKRAWCRRETGKAALLPRWLHAYGYNQTRNLRCNQIRTKKGWQDQPTPTAVKNIIAYRKRLIRLLDKRRRNRSHS